MMRLEVEILSLHPTSQGVLYTGDVLVCSWDERASNAIHCGAI